MNNILLCIFITVTYCYSTTALLFLIFAVSAVCRKSLSADKLANIALVITLYAHAWLGGAAVVLFLWLSGYFVLLQDAVNSNFPILISLLFKGFVLTMLVQFCANWERKRQLTHRPVSHISMNRNIHGVRYWLFFVNFVVAMPLVEEMVFRYLFLAHQPAIAQTIVFLLISAVLFSYIHRKTYVTYFIAGLVLGANFLMTQSYWECVIIHIINNIWVEIVYLLRTIHCQGTASVSVKSENSLKDG